LYKRTGSINHIVDYETGSPLYVTDDIHHLRNVCLDSPLVDHCEFRVQTLSKRPGALNTSGIRRDDRQIRKGQFLKIFHQHRSGEEMVDRDIKEALNRGRMQVYRQQAIDS